MFHGEVQRDNGVQIRWLKKKKKLWLENCFLIKGKWRKKLHFSAFQAFIARARHLPSELVLSSCGRSPWPDLACHSAFWPPSSLVHAYAHSHINGSSLMNCLQPSTHLLNMLNITPSAPAGIQLFLSGHLVWSLAASACSGKHDFGFPSQRLKLGSCSWAPNP